jgi:hypothetical protein
MPHSGEGSAGECFIGLNDFLEILYRSEPCPLESKIDLIREPASAVG